MGRPVTYPVICRQNNGCARTPCRLFAADGRGVHGVVADLHDDVRGVRPAVDPARAVLRALRLQYLYTTRSERLLMEETDDSVLIRWVRDGRPDLIADDLCCAAEPVLG
jgi:hypothetical protein